MFIYDAFSLLAHTIKENNLKELFTKTPPNMASCVSGQSWSSGSVLMKFLKKTKLQGLTGHIEFDKLTGYRKNLTLLIVDKAKTGVDTMGYWRENNVNKTIEVIRSYAKEKSQVLIKLNRHLNVTTKLVSTGIFLIDAMKTILFLNFNF